MDLENDNDKCTLDSDVLKSNPRGENEKQSCRSLINPKFSTQWLEPWPWYTFGGDRREGGGYDSLSLSL